METTRVDAVDDQRRTAAGAQSARAEAFRGLADRHLDSSYGLARAILRHPAEAEDATHDAFVTAWRKWDTLRDPDLFERWFHRILVNTCRNRLRDSARSRARDLSSPLSLVAPDEYSASDDRALLWPAIERLTPDQQILLALRFYIDLSIDQIAARVGVRSGTVKSRLHRALLELRTVLDQADPQRTLG